MKERERIEEHRFSTVLCVPLLAMRQATGKTLVREGVILSVLEIS